MKPSFITNVDWEILQKKYPNNLEEIVTKLNNNYPVQYLIGSVPFLNTNINVNESVLIPRFETEYLVEKTIKKIKKSQLEPCNIIDLGTGSACIAISLKKNLSCNVTAIDISDKSLEVAHKNALENDVLINFINQKIEDLNLNNYDVIISNPPYVSLKEPTDPKIKYEPQNAIFANENGLYFYRIILEKIGKLTKKPKLIAFEIGMNQASAIEKITKENLKYQSFIIEKDLTGKDRYIFIEPLNNN